MALTDHTRAETDEGVGFESATAGDFIQLLKPRVMSLVVFTALVGMVIAPGTIHPVLGAVALMLIAVGAGASGCLNMWYDADIDAVMSRTRTRPIPAGRVGAETALAFGLTLAVASVILLGLMVNELSAGLLAFTIAFYVLVYTMWLKRSTPQNIVIGGAAGALPPVIGWAAVTGHVAVEPLVLFLIIFLWTPPHFWALALIKSGDYARAGVPMLPVVAGEKATRAQILLYALVLAPVGVAPWFMGFGGLAYGIVSVVLGAMFVALSARVFFAPASRLNRAAGQLFAFSILYLFLLFAVLLGERVVQLLLAAPVAG
mgnify:CR=1 FL=1